MVQDIIISLLRTISNTPEALEILKTSILKPALTEVMNEAREKDIKSKLLTIAEAADLFGVTKTTIHIWSKNSLITKHKLPNSNKTFYKLEELENALIAKKCYQRSL